MSRLKHGLLSLMALLGMFVAGASVHHASANQNQTTTRPQNSDAVQIDSVENNNIRGRGVPQARRNPLEVYRFHNQPASTRKPAFHTRSYQNPVKIVPVYNPKRGTEDSVRYFSRRAKILSTLQQGDVIRHRRTELDRSLRASDNACWGAKGAMLAPHRVRHARHDDYHRMMRRLGAERRLLSRDTREYHRRARQLSHTDRHFNLRLEHQHKARRRSAQHAVHLSHNSWFRDGLGHDELQARHWVTWHESNDRWYVISYGGVCVGYFQLNPVYLGYRNGHVDLRKRHQVHVADRYVRSRYGNWVNAQAFWENHHWY